VDEFIEALSAKRAAPIAEYIEEHLNGRAPAAAARRGNRLIGSGIR
jgi:hypothetical protein